jgi:hypothetical protein
MNTPFRHDDMRDAGSKEAQASIDAMVDKFLTDTDNNAVTPVEPSTPNIVGPVPTYVPVAPVQN